MKLLNNKPDKGVYLMKYDVLIIGGGISGTAIAHELAKFKLKTILLERGTDVCVAASRQNGAVIHQGYESHRGTLKAELDAKGAKMVPQLAKDLDFKTKKTGKIMVAFQESDLDEIDELIENAVYYDVPNVHRVTAEELWAREPHLSKEAIGALISEDCLMVDPYQMAIAYMENAMDNGVELALNEQVRKITKNGEEDFTVFTEKNQYQTRFVVNAAGVHCDDVAAMAGIHEYKMQGRHGELFVLDTGHYTTGIAFPVPNNVTKGIAIVPTVAGNALIGSTADMRPDKEDVSNDVESFNQLLTAAKKLVPDFDPRCIIRSFAGMRPVCLDNGNDFYIKEAKDVKGFVHVAGIQSPGIGASPAVAEYVRDILAGSGLELKAKEDYNPYRKEVPDFSDLSLEEKDAIIQQDSRWGKIVCRCETVPEGEIVANIHRTLGATTVEAVKRRTRAGMGRCQSGFCQYKVVQILARELGIPEEEVMFQDKDSKILFGKIKG